MGTCDESRAEEREPIPANFCTKDPTAISVDPTLIASRSGAREWIDNIAKEWKNAADEHA